jgi:hypothetical protein
MFEIVRLNPECTLRLATLFSLASPAATCLHRSLAEIALELQIGTSPLGESTLALQWRVGRRRANVNDSEAKDGQDPSVPS